MARSVQQALQDYDNDRFIRHLHRTTAVAESCLFRLNELEPEELHSAPFSLAGTTFDFEKQELVFTVTKDVEILRKWRDRLGEYLVVYTTSAYPEFLPNEKKKVPKE